MASLKPLWREQRPDNAADATGCRRRPVSWGSLGAGADAEAGRGRGRDCTWAAAMGVGTGAVAAHPPPQGQTDLLPEQMHCSSWFQSRVHRRTMHSYGYVVWPE